MQMFLLNHRKPLNPKQATVEMLSHNSGHLKKSETGGVSYILWAYLLLLLLHFLCVHGHR